MTNLRILLVVNSEWYFWSHRLSLAKALRDAGCDVVVAASVERGYDESIVAEGLRFIPLRLQRRSIAPYRELASIWELFQLYQRERPDLVHHLTIKPVLYGSIAAKAARIPLVINAIPGLGYMFLGSGWHDGLRQQATLAAYRVALSGQQTRVIFQNPDDRALFVSRRVVPIDRTVLIRGSGVDVSQFVPSPEQSGLPIVLLASRLLWDKGVGELVEASRRLKKDGIACRVVLAGVPDPGNPKAIPVSLLECWQAEGVVEWWGLRNDMPEVLKAASIVVLPSSYPEGIPKILLEAAAAGRPIVTTDTPGCREIVRHGDNGLLVPPFEPVALAQALHRLLQDPVLRAQMGKRGRAIVTSEFSEEQVIKETLSVYSELLRERWPQASQLTRA
jgi:glycosyltransferase involved in cell wall biosynthesis